MFKRKDHSHFYPVKYFKNILLCFFILLSSHISAKSGGNKLFNLSSYQRTDPECYKEIIKGKIYKSVDANELEKLGFSYFILRSQNGDKLNINIDLTDENGNYTKKNMVIPLKSLLQKDKLITVSAYWCAKDLTLDSIK